MTYALRYMVLVSLLIITVSKSWAMKPVAVVNAAQASNGLVRGMGNECVVVVPQSFASQGPFSVLARDGEEVPTHKLAELSPQLELYRLEMNPGLLCLDLWPNPDRVALLLQSGRSAWLDSPLFNPENPESRVAIEEFGNHLLLTGQDDLAPGNDRLGSLVRVRFSPVGMVVGFDREFGAAHAVRFDEMTRWLDEYSELHHLAKALEEKPLTITPLEGSLSRQIAQKTKLRHEPADESHSIRILKEGWQVDVIGKVEGSPWYAVRYFGLDGFVPGAALQ